MRSDKPAITANDVRIVTEDSEKQKKYESALSSETPQKSSPNARMCPFCGHQLKPGAIKCINCGRYIEQFKEMELKEQGASRQSQKNSPEKCSVVNRRRFNILLIYLSILSLVLIAVSFNYLSSDYGECTTLRKTPYYSYVVTTANSDIVNAEGVIIKHGGFNQLFCHKYTPLDRVGQFLYLALGIGLIGLLIHWYRKSKPITRDILIVYSIAAILFLYYAFILQRPTYGSVILLLLLSPLIFSHKIMGVDYSSSDTTET